jgi:hypothetical protein
MCYGTLLAFSATVRNIAAVAATGFFASMQQAEKGS